MAGSIWPDGQQTEELLEGARRGDQQAVDHLLDRHRDSLRRMIGLRLDHKIQRRVDLSDGVQDVLLEVNRRLQHPSNRTVMGRLSD